MIKTSCSTSFRGEFSIVLICLLHSIFSANGQVYNYEPINHYNFETNPAVLATHKFEQLVKIKQQGAPLLSSNNFSNAGIKASKYFERYFVGVGLTAQHTRQNDSARYNHFGAGLAYRNVLFDKVYIRAGLLYKWIDVKAPTGFFSNYEFNAFGSPHQQTIEQNINWSVSISSPSDFFHVSFGELNKTPFWTVDTSYFFPTYQFVNVGDFMKFINRDIRFELMYTFIITKHENLNLTSKGHYLLFFGNYALTRKLSLKYGGRFGIVNHSHYHFTPSVGLFNEHQYYLKFGVDLGYQTNGWHQQFSPVSQISISKKF